MKVALAHMPLVVCNHAVGHLKTLATRCGLAVFLVASTLAGAETLLPTKAQRVALFDALVSEIERLDGDGLINRHTRPESWRQTTSKLRDAAATANSPIEYGQVFHRLRATYPNFHAGVSIADAYRGAWMQSDAKLPVLIRAEAVGPGQPRPPLRIAQVDEAWAKSTAPEATLPRVGDIVIAMNGRTVDEWHRENEVFCKQPTLAQCPIEFHRNLARGLLFWHPDAPLALEIIRTIYSRHLPSPTSRDFEPAKARALKHSTTPSASSLEMHPRGQRTPRSQSGTGMPFSL